MTFTTGRTKDGQVYVALTERGTDHFIAGHDEKIILKAYGSPDGKKIRIVLPELTNFAQTRIDTDSHYIEFTRDAAAARREIDRRTK